MINIGTIARKTVSAHNLSHHMDNCNWQECSFINANPLQTEKSIARINAQAAGMTDQGQDREGFFYDNLFDFILAETPAEVKAAWEKTKKELDIHPSGLGVVINGQRIYELGLMPRMIAAQYNAGTNNDGSFKTRPEDFLGKSVASAIDAIKDVVDGIAHPAEGRHLSHADRQVVMAMYLTFLKYLEAI